MMEDVAGAQGGAQGSVAAPTAPVTPVAPLDSERDVEAEWILDMRRLQTQVSSADALTQTLYHLNSAGAWFALALTERPDLHDALTIEYQQLVGIVQAVRQEATGDMSEKRGHR